MDPNVLLYDRRFTAVFSGRRRHTICSRDWSSDVCSSDLTRCHGSRVLSAFRVSLWYSRTHWTMLSLRVLSLITTNSHGCMLKPEGAQRAASIIFSTRSEEHTSELQSRLHLVCR